MASITVKASLGGVTKRIPVESGPLDFDSLLQLIAARFEQAPDDARLLYHDGEEWISLTSDVEVREAMEWAKTREGSVLRVTAVSSSSDQGDLPNVPTSPVPSPLAVPGQSPQLQQLLQTVLSSSLAAQYGPGQGPPPPGTTTKDPLTPSAGSSIPSAASGAAGAGQSGAGGEFQMKPEEWAQMSFFQRKAAKAKFYKEVQAARKALKEKKRAERIGNSNCPTRHAFFSRLRDTFSGRKTASSDSTKQSSTITTEEKPPLTPSSPTTAGGSSSAVSPPPPPDFVTQDTLHPAQVFASLVDPAPGPAQVAEPMEEATVEETGAEQASSSSSAPAPPPYSAAFPSTVVPAYMTGPSGPHPMINPLKVALMSEKGVMPSPAVLVPTMLRSNPAPTPQALADEPDHPADPNDAGPEFWNTFRQQSENFMERLRTAYRTAETTDDEVTQPSFHMGIQCDRCNGQPIVGPRWECQTCPDYSLCTVCYNKVQASLSGDNPLHDPTHVMERLDRPRAPWHPSRRFKFFSQSQSQCKESAKESMSACGSGAARPAEPASSDGDQCTFGASACRDPVGFCGSLTLASLVIGSDTPDGTVIAPVASFTKSWQFMAPPGSVAWPEGTSLEFVGGDLLNAPHRVPLEGRTEAGTEVVVAVPMVAPEEPGRYLGYWRLAFEGARFGQRVWVDITVADPANVVSRSLDSMVISSPILSTGSAHSSSDHDGDEAPGLPADPPLPSPARKGKRKEREDDDLQSTPTRLRPSAEPTKRSTAEGDISPSIRSPIDVALDELETLGFFDRRSNRALLHAHGGDLQAVKDALAEAALS